MVESRQHMALVAAAREWAANTYFSGHQSSVLVHSAVAPSATAPPIIDGYIPDLYARLHGKAGEIIGEAKTAGDLDNAHTLEQLTAFLWACSRSDQSLFVFAVPWHCERAAKNLIRLLSKSGRVPNANSVVLPGLPG